MARRTSLQKVYNGLPGRKFGEWVVLHQLPSKYGLSMWLCRCSCGIESAVPYYRLIAGKSTRCATCGRMQGGLSRTLPDNQSRKNTILQTYKRHAAERGISWLLTDEQFFRLIESACAYCNAEPLSGVDRADNRLPYSALNSVPCCALCNRWKSDMTVEEFINHVRKIFVQN